MGSELKEVVTEKDPGRGASLAAPAFSRFTGKPPPSAVLGSSTENQDKSILITNLQEQHEEHRPALAHPVLADGAAIKGKQR
jgi:hypothetical protein